VEQVGSQCCHSVWLPAGTLRCGFETCTLRFAISTIRATLERILARLAALGVSRLEVGIEEITGAAEALRNEQKRITTLLNGLVAAQSTGEKLALQIARASELSRRRELDRELTTTRQKLQEAEKELRLRRQTYDLATRLVEELQAATTDIVEAELSRIGAPASTHICKDRPAPIIQNCQVPDSIRVPARASPHVDYRHDRSKDQRGS
jgi:hypothetical protein